MEATNQNYYDGVRDDSGREYILFGERVFNGDRADNVTHFDDATPENLGELLQKGYIRPADGQNDSPDALAFLRVGARLEYDGATVRYTGYVVPEYRDDSRVTITGMVAENLTAEQTITLQEMFRGADECYQTDDGDAGYTLDVWYD